MRPAPSPYYRLQPQTTSPEAMENASSLRNDADSPHFAHHNFILIFGPDVPSFTVSSTEDACRERGFSVETFRTAGLHSLDDLRLRLHSGDKLGPHTQVVLVYHGSKDAHGKHMLTMTSHGQREGLVPTVETLRSLRRSGNGDAAPDQRHTWGGTMHLVTCEGGELDQEILPQDAAWQLDGNHLARQCLRLALAQETLPADVAGEWQTREEAHPQQRLDDARMLKAGSMDADQAPSALEEACRQGDVMLLDMLLQRFGLASGSQADRPQLAQRALSRKNGGELLSRLLDNALLHGDVAMFRATWAHAGGRQFIRKHGRLMLDRACLGNQAGIARYLLRKVGMGKHREASGDTALHLAASTGSQEVLALLLTMAPALDQADKAGDTALHVACRAGQEQIVQQLLTAGAATNIRNANGETALNIAEAECLPDTVALLGQARS